MRLDELPEYFTPPVRVRARVRNPVTGQVFYISKTFYCDSREVLKLLVIEWLAGNQFRPSDVLSVRAYL